MYIRKSHHELILWKTLGRDGVEHPGFMTALLGDLTALSRQLPVFGGSLFCCDHL